MFKPKSKPNLLCVFCNSTLSTPRFFFFFFCHTHAYTLTMQTVQPQRIPAGRSARIAPEWTLSRQRRATVTGSTAPCFFPQFKHRRLQPSFISHSLSLSSAHVKHQAVDFSLPLMFPVSAFTATISSCFSIILLTISSLSTT